MTVLTDEFERNRAHLRAVAYRMLGSVSEAEDAVQEAWLRLHRSDTSGVSNLAAWLTTVVGRVCLDMLRARRARRARRRVQGAAPDPDADLAEQRRVVDAFLAAARGGDFEALLELLDPSVVFRADRGALAPRAPAVVRGAEEVARTVLSRGAPFEPHARPAIVHGGAGLAVRIGGRPA